MQVDCLCLHLHVDIFHYHRNRSSNLIKIVRLLVQYFFMLYKLRILFLVVNVVVVFLPRELFCHDANLFLYIVSQFFHKSIKVSYCFADLAFNICQYLFVFKNHITFYLSNVSFEWFQRFVSYLM